MGHIGPHVKLDPSAYVHESAYVYGDVTIGPDVSVWINVAIRAEMHGVRIGARSSSSTISSMTCASASSCTIANRTGALTSPEGRIG